MAPISGAIICFVACQKGCQQQTDKKPSPLAAFTQFPSALLSPGKYYDDLHNFSAPTAAAKKKKRKKNNIKKRPKPRILQRILVCA